MAKTIEIRRQTRKLKRRLEAERRSVFDIERQELQHQSRQKEQYEKWLTDRADLFRESLAAFLKVYTLTKNLDTLWRGLVYSRNLPPTPALDSQIRGIYALWFSYCGMYEDKLRYYGRHKKRFDPMLDRLSRHKREASEILHAWESPVPSSAPSFRPVTLSDEAVSQLSLLFPGSV